MTHLLLLMAGVLLAGAAQASSVAPPPAAPLRDLHLASLLLVRPEGPALPAIDATAVAAAPSPMAPALFAGPQPGLAPPPFLGQSVGLDPYDPAGPLPPPFPDVKIIATPIAPSLLGSATALMSLIVLARRRARAS